MLRSALFSLITPILLLVSGCETVRLAERDLTNFNFSATQEQQLGNDYAQQLNAEEKTIEDPEIQAWVDRLGAELLEGSPSTPQTFKFYVTAKDEVNAFAIPGGHCYLNKGLIMTAESEAEVAAVMGHEINHVTMRHGMRSLQRQTGLSVISSALKADDSSAAIAKVIAENGGILAMRGFSREDEREADRYGVEAMHKAGYNPKAAATFFEKLKALQGGGSSNLMSQLFSTHPATQERIDAINKQIKELPAKPYRSDSVEFARVREILKSRSGS